MMRLRAACATVWAAAGMLWLSQASALPAGKWTWADHPFDGTWVIQPDLTAFELRSPILSFDGGMFRRTECRTGPLEVPADGASHEVKGQVFFDSASVTVKDRLHIEVVERLAAKQVWRGVYALSNDGRTLALRFEDDRAANPVTGLLSYEHDGDPVAGAHPLSGTWLPKTLSELSTSGLTMTFKTASNYVDVDAGAAVNSGQDFNLTQSDGRSGKVDAHDYPLSGYLPRASVSISRLQPNLLQINRSQSGQLVEISRALVSDDGQTLTLSQTDWLCQAKTILTLKKK